MQTDIQTKLISGETYGVRMLAPRVANRMFIRIIKTIGPSLGVLVEELDEDKVKGGLKGLLDSKDIDGAFIGKVAKELCERLNEDDIENMMDTLAKVSEVEEKQLFNVFDMHFHGKLSELYAWFAFALEVQFGNFGRAWTNDSSPSLQAKTGAV